MIAATTLGGEVLGSESGGIGAFVSATFAFGLHFSKHLTFQRLEGRLEHTIKATNPEPK